MPRKVFISSWIDCQVRWDYHVLECAYYSTLRMKSKRRKKFDFDISIQSQHWIYALQAIWDWNLLTLLFIIMFAFSSLILIIFKSRIHFNSNVILKNCAAFQFSTEWTLMKCVHFRLQCLFNHVTKSNKNCFLLLLCHKQHRSELNTGKSFFAVSISPVCLFNQLVLSVVKQNINKMFA